MDDWPSYQVAPKEVVHAVGVAIINYRRFERTYSWMLAATLNVDLPDAHAKITKTTSVARLELISAAIPLRSWPPQILALVHSYIDAARVIIQNRNLLAHANMVGWLPDKATIYSESRQGALSQIEATLNDVRRVADDIETYYQFGLSASNYIAIEMNGMDRQAGTIRVKELPVIPPEPFRLKASL